MIEKGDAIRLGCLGCLNYVDNEVVDVFLEGKPTDTYIKIIAKCECGSVNMYRFKHMGTTPLTPGAKIYGGER